MKIKIKRRLLTLCERCRCKKCREQREIIKQVAKVYAMNYAGKLCHDILYKDVEEGKYDTE